MKRKFSKILGVAVTLAMLGSLLVAAAPASADVTQATVTLSEEEISADANYTIVFDVHADLPSDGTGDLIFEFPVDTVVGTIADGDITVQSASLFEPDNVETPILAVNVTAVQNAITDVYTVTIDTVDLTNDIAEGSTVRVKFTGLVITNPSAPDDYTLKVSTSEETDKIESAAYTIEKPTVAELEGVVSLKNPSGILMKTFTGDGAITNAINYAVSDNFTIEVGPGTYDNEDIGGLPDGLTIVATGGAGVTTLGDVSYAVNFNTVDLDGDDAVLDGFNIMGANVINILADDVVVQNCTFMYYGLATVTSGAAITIGDGGTDAIVKDCTFYLMDPLWGVDFGYSASGVMVGDATNTTDDAVITGCTFNLDDGKVGVTVNGLPADDTNIEDSTFNGPLGTGITVTDGDLVTITGNTLDGLEQAISITDGTVLVETNIISNSVPDGYTGAINVGTGTVNILNNTISGTAFTDTVNYDEWAISVVNAFDVNIMFNTFTSNILSIINWGANDLNATLNWWGGAPAGIAAPADFGCGTTVSEPYLGIAAAGVIDTAVEDLDAQDEAGIIIDTNATAGNEPALMAASAYDGNPQGALPDETTGVAFFDVYVSDTGDADEILLKFYSDGITANTVAYVWSELGGDWWECVPQGVNMFGGFVWVKLSANTIPSILNLSGTPFALVESEVVAEDAPDAPTIGTPVFGDMEAAIQPTFTWTAPATAISYEFVLAEEPEDANQDKFAIIDYSATTDINGHVAREQLKYDTVYNWRVRAVSDVGASPWATGFFTTITEPVPEPDPIPPVIIKETPPTPAPEIILNVPPATKQEVQVIPDYLLWVVVAVGAVLIIAVVVLIVRTRRVA